MLECHRRLLCVNGVQRALIPNLRLGNEADARADVRHAPARRHVCCHAQPSPAQPSTTTRLPLHTLASSCPAGARAAKLRAPEFEPGHCACAPMRAQGARRRDGRAPRTVSSRASRAAMPRHGGAPAPAQLVPRCAPRARASPSLASRGARGNGPRPRLPLRPFSTAAAGPMAVSPLPRSVSPHGTFPPLLSALSSSFLAAWKQTKP